MGQLRAAAAAAAAALDVVVICSTVHIPHALSERAYSPLGYCDVSYTSIDLRVETTPLRRAEGAGRRAQLVPVATGISLVHRLK